MDGQIIYIRVAAIDKILVFSQYILITIKYLNIGTTLSVRNFQWSKLDAATGSNIVNGSNNIPTNSIQVGQSIIGMEVDHDRNILYLVDNSLDSLLVVNSNTGNVIDSIDVGKYPLMIAYNEKTGFLYVSNEYSNSISVIKPEF